MAVSKGTYVCFACRKNGFDNVHVYLDGKDAEGKTKYLNQDGKTPHQHKKQTNSTSTTATTNTDLSIQIQHLSNEQKLIKGSISIVQATLNKLIQVLNDQYQLKQQSEGKTLSQ